MKKKQTFLFFFSYQKGKNLPSLGWETKKKTWNALLNGISKPSTKSLSTKAGIRITRNLAPTNKIFMTNIVSENYD